MTLTIAVQGVDISNVSPGEKGNPTLFSGNVRVAISPAGGTRISAIQTAVPFENVPSLGQAITKALNDLHDYGNDLMAAAQLAAAQYKS